MAKEMSQSNKNKVKSKALDLMAELLFNKTESCPLGEYGLPVNSKCEKCDGARSYTEKCWVKYFEKEAEIELGINN